MEGDTVYDCEMSIDCPACWLAAARYCFIYQEPSNCGQRASNCKQVMLQSGTRNHHRVTAFKIWMCDNLVGADNHVEWKKAGIYVWYEKQISIIPYRNYLITQKIYIFISGPFHDVVEPFPVQL